jgi:Tfp pilus assembly protein FimV
MKSVLTAIFLLLPIYAHAASIKVQVYDKGQQYWDVKSGQTLSQICQKLRPVSNTSRRACQQQILKKNPDAFIKNDPNRLILGKRLWLPGSYRPASQMQSDQYHIRNFSWGSVKTPK